MATYQEQIEKTRGNQTLKAMAAMAVLADLERGLSIMVAEKMIDNEARIAAMKKYILNHPEINEAIERAHGSPGDK